MLGCCCQQFVVIALAPSHAIGSFHRVWAEDSAKLDVLDLLWTEYGSWRDAPPHWVSSTAEALAVLQRD
jgi:hypothetical protein